MSTEGQPSKPDHKRISPEVWRPLASEFSLGYSVQGSAKAWGQVLEESAETIGFPDHSSNTTKSVDAWTSLVNAVIASGSTAATPSGASYLIGTENIEEGDLDEERRKKRGVTEYSGPSYKYAIPGTEEWGKAHNSTTQKHLKELGIEIQHKFRQFLRITWNKVIDGNPSSPEPFHEGWDSLKIPSVRILTPLPLPGRVGPRAGEIPPNILKGGDFPKVAPGGGWKAPKGNQVGDRAQFLYQYMTLRCERTVKDGKASAWWTCGRWYWWILFVFTLVEVSGRETKVKGTYKKGDGKVPDSVKEEAGLSDSDVVDSSLLKKYNCNSS